MQLLTVVKVGVGQQDGAKKELLAQLQHLNANYSGGLGQYIRNAQKLLQASRDGMCSSASLPASYDLGCVATSCLCPLLPEHN